MPMPLRWQSVSRYTTVCSTFASVTTDVAAPTLAAGPALLGSKNAWRRSAGSSPSTARPRRGPPCVRNSRFPGASVDLCSSPDSRGHAHMLDSRGTVLLAHPGDAEAALADYEQALFPRSAVFAAE